MPLLLPIAHLAAQKERFLVAGGVERLNTPPLRAEKGDSGAEYLLWPDFAAIWRPNAENPRRFVSLVPEMDWRRRFQHRPGRFKGCPT
jgi:hypothetical protein